MRNQDLYDLGEKIQEMVQNAVTSQDYKQLNQNINQTINNTVAKAVDTGAKVWKETFGQEKAEDERESFRRQYEQAKGGISSRQERRERKREYSRARRPQWSAAGNESREKSMGFEWQRQLPVRRYGRIGGAQISGFFMSIFGSLGAIIFFFFTGVGLSSLYDPAFVVFSIIGAVLTGASSLMLWKGIRRLGLVGRFKKYIAIIGTDLYYDVEELSRISGVPLKKLRKDLRLMIQNRWFLQGYLDRQETCLMTTRETYEQYQMTQKQLEERMIREQKAKEEAAVSTDGVLSERVQEVLDEGNKFIQKIHESNDAILGEEISKKISRMELIVKRIFQRVKEDPEVIEDLKKMMDYYLPTTVKLLDAYEDMDRQPIQGENIQSAKKEIEDTLDTLNVAFEKILDSIFQEVAWDVSSDISVLHTVLAQEGLTKDDFNR